MTKTYNNFIDGTWVPSVSGKTFLKINPANKEEILGIFPRSNKEDIENAVIAAKNAFELWSQTSPPRRGKILFEIAKKMEDKKHEIAEIIMKEQGKTLSEALGETNAGIDMCYFMAGEGRRLYGEVTYSELDNRLAIVKRYPIGVCGIITPWNFPVSMFTWKVFPALICGNTVVIKPASDTPVSANLLCEIFSEAGLPKGVVNVVHGLGSEAGNALVNHPDVRMISFTGSTEIGKQIAGACAKRLAKVSLELGGKNAVIVMDDCNIDTAVSAVVKGAFTVAGERCTATSRVIVHEKIYAQFLEKLITETKKLKVGPGNENDTNVCPVINETQLKKIEDYIEIGKREGATLVLGGRRLSDGIYSKGFYFEPTIFVDVKSDMRIAKEEIFGPVLVVIKAKSFEEAVNIHNSVEYGLSGSIFTNNINHGMLALDKMQVGVCYVNGPTFGSEVHLPFGGVKQSGNGHREVGKAAIDTFTELKTIYIDYSGVVQNAQFKK
ncbi:MAG: aldehyde dehydrogenase family protein [Candidatus Micrarchaeia archaeon]